MAKGVTMVMGRRMHHQHLEHGVNIRFTSRDLEHASTPISDDRSMNVARSYSVWLDYFIRHCFFAGFFVVGGSILIPHTTCIFEASLGCSASASSWRWSFIL